MLAYGCRAELLLLPEQARSWQPERRLQQALRLLCLRPPPITATTVLMVTVAPSATLISVRVPATGEGISASTLSVEISKIGSSRWTVSPTFFSHLVMVPSVMDSPICGMRTSVPGPAAGRSRRGCPGCGGSIDSGGRGGIGLQGQRRSRPWRNAARGSAFLDGADDGVDLDGRAFADLDLFQRTGGGRWNFGVDLVGRDLEQRLVALRQYRPAS